MSQSSARGLAHTHTESDITDLTHITTLATLSDATITAIASGELLQWNGSAWINQTIAELGLLTDIVGDTTPQLGAALDGQGFDLNNLGVIFLTEQAAAEADVAGKGQLWVKTATPNELWFTDDAGTDFQLLSNDGPEYTVEWASEKDTDLATGTGTYRWYPPFDITIQDVSISCGTAPTGAAIIVDVHHSGTTIFTTQGNRPTIAISGFFDGSPIFTPKAIPPKRLHLRLTVMLILRMGVLQQPLCRLILNI
jgi:hypothetical protein